MSGNSLQSLAEQVLAVWQPRIVPDWKVQVAIQVPNKDTIGEVTFNCYSKEALIRVHPDILEKVQKETYYPGRPLVLDDLVERTIVHELLHLWGAFSHNVLREFVDNNLDRSSAQNVLSLIGDIDEVLVTSFISLLGMLAVFQSQKEGD